MVAPGSNKTLINADVRDKVVDFLDLVRQHPDVMNQHVKDRANELFWLVKPKRNRGRLSQQKKQSKSRVTLRF